MHQLDGGITGAFKLVGVYAVGLEVGDALGPHFFGFTHRHPDIGGDKISTRQSFVKVVSDGDAGT